MKKMPDIAMDGRPSFAIPIHWAGMKRMEIPLHWSEGGQFVALASHIDAAVDVSQAGAKGIHMSRLYEILYELSEKTCSLSRLRRTSRSLLSSHGELSRNARIQMSAQFPLKRQALLSEKFGWRYYPIELDYHLRRGDFGYESKLSFSVKIAYSSTCPCSAALARQLICEKFSRDFSTAKIDREAVLHWLNEESGIMATPHGQRSEATISWRLKRGSRSLRQFSWAEWIGYFERAINTPVQAAVKRLDEQEFARLNGGHLMFAEDAVRLFGKALKGHSDVAWFHVETEHFESLHPHDAFAELWST